MSEVRVETLRPGPSGGSWLREKLAEYKARFMFDVLFKGEYITETTHFLNIGYWKDGPATLDAACRSLARLAGRVARIGPGKEVLDVGCGFADTDLFWREEFQPKRIVGLNISRFQIEHARRVVAERGAGDSIEFRLGSASSLPFEAESFDVVVSVESIQDFPSREVFFQESHRVLRPGGRFAVSDIIAMPGVEMRDPNLCDRAEYARRLERAGFSNVRVESIREHVFEPYREYLVRRMKDREVMRRVNPVIRFVLRGIARNPRQGEAWDYVLATGDR